MELAPGGGGAIPRGNGRGQRRAAALVANGHGREKEQKRRIGMVMTDGRRVILRKRSIP